MRVVGYDWARTAPVIVPYLAVVVALAPDLPVQGVLYNATLAR